jgi:hypothetical protein
MMVCLDDFRAAQEERLYAAGNAQRVILTASFHIPVREISDLGLYSGKEVWNVLVENYGMTRSTQFIAQ